MSTMDNELINKKQIEQEQINEKQISYENITEEEFEFLNRPVEPQKWYQWFSKSDSQEERELIIKLDLIIWLYLFLSSFAKTPDCTVVTYAYVSGMKEDLKMYGNQLTYQLSCYMAGFIVGQIPLTMLALKLPINLYLPIMDSL